jgi:hypothetical protein
MLRGYQLVHALDIFGILSVIVNDIIASINNTSCELFKMHTTSVLNRISESTVIKRYTQLIESILLNGKK